MAEYFAGGHLHCGSKMDGISLGTLANYIGLVPELDQLHDHLISIESRIKEAVNILKGD